MTTRGEGSEAVQRLRVEMLAQTCTALQQELEGWAAAVPIPPGGDGWPLAARVEVATGEGGPPEQTWLGVYTARHLQWALAAHRARYAAATRAEDAARRAAEVIVKARLAGADAGQLLAEALQLAADQLGGRLPVLNVDAMQLEPPELDDVTFYRGLGAGRLVRGRPGSWEADLVVHFAREGGWLRREDEEARSALAQVFTDAAHEYEPLDGGQLAADALRAAAGALGGVEALAAGSAWELQLRYLAGPGPHPAPKAEGEPQP